MNFGSGKYTYSLVDGWGTVPAAQPLSTVT